MNQPRALSPEENLEENLIELVSHLPNPQFIQEITQLQTNIETVKPVKFGLHLNTNPQSQILLPELIQKIGKEGLVQLTRKYGFIIIENSKLDYYNADKLPLSTHWSIELMEERSNNQPLPWHSDNLDNSRELLLLHQDDQTSPRSAQTGIAPMLPTLQAIQKALPSIQNHPIPLGSKQTNEIGSHHDLEQKIQELIYDCQNQQVCPKKMMNFFHFFAHRISPEGNQTLFENTTLNLYPNYYFQTWPNPNTTLIINDIFFMHCRLASQSSGGYLWRAFI